MSVERKVRAKAASYCGLHRGAQEILILLETGIEISVYIFRRQYPF